jgi:hypothetical protein
MASAILSYQEPYCFTDFGSEPAQEHTQTHQECDASWQLQPSNFNWSDLDDLALDSGDLDWMWQPLDDATISQSSDFMSTPDAYSWGEFIPDNTPLLFAATETLSPPPAPTFGALSPTSSSVWNISPTSSYLRSPYVAPITPPPAFSSPTRPEPKPLYTCTTCHPNRSYSKPQYLK